MAHQNLMFDSFHTLDNAHASFMLSNPSAYNTYAGNPQQYSNGSFSGNWDLSETNSHAGYNSSSHPRTGVSNPNLLPHSTHASGFNHGGGYHTYTTTSPSYEPQRPHTGYQGSHSRVGPSHRPRSDDDIVYSMLSPNLSDMPNNHNATLPMTANTERERDVTWAAGPRTSGHPLQGTAPDITPEAFGWSPHPADNQFLTFDPPWNDSMSSPLSSPDVHLHMSREYNYALEVSPLSPPQPRSAASYALRHVSPTSSSSSPPTSRRGSVDIPSGGKVCSHCHATSTPLWRREPTTLKPLCNACGLYLQQRNRHRPQELIDADAADDSDVSDGDTSGPECSHCHTHHTSVWRRSKTGAQLCNACGVYSRLRGRDRPLSLKRNRIKPRSKHTPTTTTTTATATPR
ncbi:hypothetical protein D9615_010174 [Tricholomella constricta]|uniref:GATA-type domain-containing protein n=1 Tax=Tricholomella constricta TaxID=117010 RepID=A0A8H5GR79_9AGAR|nr:hypothetical protein D9615_010174 [Tricholomella constricta]